jgi:hypothetical protein
MATAEDRQAKALEAIANSGKEMGKVLSALNDNLVAMFKYIKHQIELDNSRLERLGVLEDEQKRQEPHS